MVIPCQTHKYAPYFLPHLQRNKPLHSECDRQGFEIPTSYSLVSEGPTLKTRALAADIAVLELIRKDHLADWAAWGGFSAMADKGTGWDSPSLGID
ncbi:Hypothetical predicted protein [Pelobates cultripes]|uniref:Uncharacterized protein n=1 Tax=Pelobates cultripes TaxID=61616 RepID=A0AAD1TD98_PELCU|nr:Hypothetical predicted protein [Pelobates cultripes]